MNQDAALKLFCKHAFRKDTPTDEFSGLSDEIVKTIGGLPLALEVIGSSLSSKRKAIWKGTLEKLRIIPNKDVHEKLRIGFEALNYEQKQIFLDIACLFIGYDITDALPMWKDYYQFSPEGEIDALIVQSLIKIEVDNEIWMHDQLRDLGREIVRQEDYKEPGRRSRFWDIDDAQNVLTNQMVSGGLPLALEEAQGSRSHVALLLPLNPQIVVEPELVAVRTESRLSGSHGDLPSGGYEYEVFLSFRGSDLRKGFTDCLYHALHEDAGVRTFRDDEELPPGEEIGGKLLKAISESKIYIPIFSQNYASSKWCLKELAFMLERKKEGNHMILPVFYDVTPTEVQDHTQYYGRALREHEEKFGAKIVQQWREALSKVGHLKGMDLVNLANGYEGQLIKFLVAKVLRELKKAQLNVTDNLVGIDDHVEAVTQLLQLGAPEVRIIGLWGMGGIGKTTLSKVIYNQIWGEFEGCSFLKDVRETASRCNGLEYLQSLLVTNLSRCAQPHFASVDEGIHELKGRYRHKKVLILLDDIDDTEQLEKLVIRHDSFGPGSRIILTTRNRDVLDGHRQQADHIYEVEAMNQDAALKLFCKHAFRKDTPTDEFSGLSDEIVKTTGGLPLALEVIGSSLSSKRKAIWEGMMEKLRIIPNKDVHEKLRISFEALEDRQKQIFLDIACFFIGEDITDAIPMWKEYFRFSPESEIDVLVVQSLIKIEDDGKTVWMHDQLRDLGREIICQENYKDPGRRSRLWDTDDAQKVLTKQMLQGSSNVEAIRVHGRKHHFTSEQFRNLPNLRFLGLDGDVRLAGDFKNLLPSLLWLRWRSPSFGTMINLCLPNLVSLELPENNLTDDDWKGLQSVQMIKLKVLDLSRSQKLTRTPDFSTFPNLERFIMCGCDLLRVIDLSISRLNKLIYLDISWCGLDSFSAVLPYIPSYFPTRLITLDIAECHNLSKLPSLSNLTLLKTLKAGNCSQLQELVGLDQLYALESLDITYCCSIKRLPDLSKLQKLEALNARDCCELQELVGLDQLYALEILDIRNCRSIKRLPDLSKLKKMEALYARHCHELQELVGLDELTSLKMLRIANFKQLKVLPDLSKLKKLVTLDAGGCEKLQEVVGLGELNALKVVDMSRCREIRNLPDLSMLNQLEKLNLFECEKLQELVGLGELEALKLLTIAVCKEIKKLPDLSKLKRLNVLDARGCEKLRGLLGLDKLGKRINLHIDGCKEIENLPQLVELGLLSSSDYEELIRDEMSVEERMYLEYW